MNRIKIIHCGDVHIGHEPSFLQNRATSRAEEILMTFEKVVKLCEREHIDLMIVSGDLFDANYVEHRYINAVAAAFASVPNTEIAICSGNHDPATVDSPYHKAIWSNNVHLFLGEKKTIHFKDKGFKVTGAGFVSSYQDESLFSSCEADDLISIGLFHGEVVSGETKSRYNPIQLEQIKNSNYDYIALGHIHKSAGVQREGMTYYAYSGCLEGRGFDELGEKGFYFGEIGKNYNNLKYYSAAKRTHLALDIDVSEVETNEQLYELVLSKIKESSPKYQNNLYKITLIGSLSTEINLSIEALIARFSTEVYFIKVYDETIVKADYELIAKENSLKGVFVKKMLQIIKESTDENKKSQAKRAIDFGLRAIDGKLNGGFYENT